MNSGDFTLNATVECTAANFTIENKGNLTLQNGDINLEGYATLNLANIGTLTATNYAVNVYNNLIIAAAVFNHSKLANLCQGLR